MKKIVDPFYSSAAWRALRQVALKRDGYRCVMCSVDVSGKGKARVDHVHPVKTHSHLKLRLDNLRVLCGSCDNQRHHFDKLGKGQAPKTFKPKQETDANGYPVGSDWG